MPILVFIVTIMNVTDKGVYNEIPVLYCKNCLSLSIRNALNKGQENKIDELDYCDKCNSTAITIGTIEEWENLYIEKFGHRYLDEYK